MLILGIRTSSKEIRYAIVEWDKQTATLLNSEDENVLKFPKTHTEIQKKLLWFDKELKRIFEKYNDISVVAIKANEYFRKENEAKRQSTHLDAVALLAAEKRGICTAHYLYSNIDKGMGSKKIQQFAESNVGRTAKKWDPKMASAVAVAWVGREN